MGTEKRRGKVGLLAGLLSAALMLGSAAAFAAEGFRVSGFGTLGYNFDSDNEFAPMRDISQLVDAKSNTRWRLDTRAGLQLEYGINSIASLVGQVVARDQFRGSANSMVNLAYLALNPTPALDLRLGRINYDTFMLADIRNVGYAYPWVRPPVDFYGWIPIFSVDGADATYNHRSDDALWRLKAQAGHSRFWIPIASGADGGYDFHAERLTGLSLTRQDAQWTVKAAYSQFSIGTEIPVLRPLHQGLAQVIPIGGPIGAEAADLLRNDSFKGAKITYSTLGAAYDNGTWAVQSEIGHSSATAATVPHGSMGYLSVARRIGNWTPFIMGSAYRPGNGKREPENNWGPYNTALRDPAVRLADTTKIDNRTLSIGARWDFQPNMALKVQLDTTWIKPWGYGLWWRANNTLNDHNRVSHVSATLDFVF
jgi:hypothetical protein